MGRSAKSQDGAGKNRGLTVWLVCFDAWSATVTRRLAEQETLGDQRQKFRADILEKVLQIASRKLIGNARVCAAKHGRLGYIWSATVARRLADQEALGDQGHKLCADILEKVLQIARKKLIGNARVCADKHGRLGYIWTVRGDGSVVGRSVD